MSEAKTPILIKLAWRNLWRRKRRTAITVSSIAVGMALCLFFTGISDGMYGKVTAMAVRLGSGHLVVEHPAYRDDNSIEHTVKVSQELLDTVRALPDLEGYSMRVSGPAIVSSSYGTVGGGYDAVDPALDEAVSLLVSQIVEGRYLQSRGEMILGAEAARKLRVKLGSKVVLTTQNRDSETVQELFRVVGFYRTRSAMLDGFYFQITLDSAQELLGLAENEVTQLGLYLESAESMADVAERLEGSAELAAAGAVVVPWQQVLRDLADYIKVDTVSGYVFQFLLFLVILAGVLNTVLMSVMERTYEFGVLLSLGMARSRLVALVVIECAMLGAIGTVVGAGLGWAENLLFHHYPISFASQLSEMSVGGFFIEPTLMMDLTVEHLLITLVLVYAMILIAGLYPAWKAGRVEPVEALHSL